MNLAEILVYSDIRQLHQMAAHYGCDCNPHSKNELITSLLLNLRRKQTIETEMERLSTSEVHFLFLLFLDKRTTLSIEDLLAKASVALSQSTDDQDMKKQEARRCISLGLKAGWLFPAKNKPVGQYQVPADIREPYIRYWVDRWKETESADSAQIEAYRDEGSALSHDIITFLNFLSAEPVPLTAEGGMYKRYQTQLLSYLSVREEPLPPQKWRFGYGLHFDQYPDRFSLLYDFCYYRKWIEESGGYTQLTAAGREWLGSPDKPPLQDELIRFWMRVYKRAVPNLPMLAQLIPLMSGGDWLPQTRLLSSLLPWIKPFYYDDAANILTNRVLKMMVHLGLLKAGQTAEGEWMYASTTSSLTWLHTYNGFTESTILLK